MRRDFFEGGFPPSKPREAKGGIRAQSRRGAFAASWWARRWIGVLEALDLGGRLARGRSYARHGQVLSIAVEKGAVAARVQGSREEPYTVSIEVDVLPSDDWRRLVAALAREARFAAALLAGRMPEDVEDAFRAAGLSLFPRRAQDLRTSCSCPDASNPCKHIAAVYYLLGEEFDRDPFLVFRLRGLDREELVAMLDASPAARAHAAAEERPAPEPLPLDTGAFWEGTPLPGDAWGDAVPPAVTAALLGRLGPFPFWRGRDPLFAMLTPVYPAAAARALDLLANLAARSPARR